METRRLILRGFASGDLPLLAGMNADPRVMRFLGGPVPEPESLAFAERVDRSFPGAGIGMLPVERRSDGVFLGIAGLNRLPWFPQDVEVGWRLRPEHWGQGYATEAGRAWLGWAFDRHPVARVISVADLPNIRSQAVMRRLGMRLDHLAVLREGAEAFEAAVHVITREDWARGPGPAEAG